MVSEFDLIRRHFTRPGQHTELGVGDDAALIAPRQGNQLAVSTDMLVAGTHFLEDTDPHDLGWKSLAVNMSDLAAMAATPRWGLLALSLPGIDAPWIEAFSAGLFECADRFGLDLIGGDTTRGPLTVTITVIGEVARGQAVLRSGAKLGDDIWVSGQPGRAALGLAALRGELELPAAGRAECIAALQRPEPRVALGQALAGVASAMLDISDGLLGDLGHILEASGCGAQIEQASLPLARLQALGASGQDARQAVLSGGDDYELLFCAPASAHQAVIGAASRAGTTVTRIGQINAERARICMRAADGGLTRADALGYDHFR